MAKGFPVAETAITSLEDIINLRECIPYSGNISFANVVLSSVGQDIGTLYWDTAGSYAIGAPFMPYIKSFEIISNRDIRVGIRVDNVASTIFKGANDNVQPNSFTRVNVQVELKANQRYVVEGQRLLRMGWNSPLSFILQAYDTADTTPLNLRVNFWGYSVTKNTDLRADNVLLWMGDSISFGTGAEPLEAGTGKEPFSQQVKKHLRSKGHRFWLTNKAQSSMTTSSVLQAINWGFYDQDKADLICCMIGANDANNLGAGGLSIAANQTIFQNNIDAIINYKKAVYPKARMIFWGSTPSADNTTETRIEIGRQIIAARVAASNDANIKYCSLATAFDRSSTANYLAADTIHPTAQNAIASAMKTFIDSTGWY